jgi:hypothetical protein
MPKSPTQPAPDLEVWPYHQAICRVLNKDTYKAGHCPLVAFVSGPVEPVEVRDKDQKLEFAEWSVAHIAAN